MGMRGQNLGLPLLYVLLSPPSLTRIPGPRTPKFVYFTLPVLHSCSPIHNIWTLIPTTTDSSLIAWAVNAVSLSSNALQTLGRESAFPPSPIPTLTESPGSPHYCLLVETPLRSKLQEIFQISAIRILFFYFLILKTMLLSSAVCLIIVLKLFHITPLCLHI